jgi:Protein of unknown function (DUF2934)
VSTETTRKGAADRALTERALKGRDIETGLANAHAIKSRQRRKAVPPPSNSVVTRSAAYIEPEARDSLIAEAAYFRSAHRGFEPGHEIDDWLAAESEIDAALARGDLNVCGNISP